MTGEDATDGGGTSDTGQADVAVVPRFANVATFLRAAHRPICDDLDVAIFGVPFDLGCSFRAGARHGPAQIREMSRLIREVNFATRVAPFEVLRAADIGDAPVNSLSIGESLESIQAFVFKVLDSGAMPLAVGGDHTISLPILRALGKKAPLALVQFDAHSDTQDKMLGKAVANGTVFRRAIEERLVDPRRCFQLGVRGTLFKADELDWALAQGVTIMGMQQLEDLGPEKTGALIRDRIGDHPTYLSFDIDVLDPSIAPGTGGLEPGGLLYRDAQKLMHALRGLRFIGADVVEVCPPLENGSLTAMTAANVLFEAFCLLAESRRS